MRDPWLQAALSQPPTMCGVRLRPYSVGHDYLLTEFGNPLVRNGIVTEAALFEAVTICGRSWEENRALWGGGQDRQGGPLTRWVLRWHRRMNFPVAVANMRTYIEDYKFIATHQTRPAKPDDRYMSAPLHWHLVGSLVARYHFTLSAAWDCAYNEAKCLFDVWAEAEGDDTLESVADMHMNDLCRKADALAKAGDDAGAEALYAQVQSFANLRKEATA